MHSEYSLFDVQGVLEYSRYREALYKINVKCNTKDMIPLGKMAFREFGIMQRVKHKGSMYLFDR